MQLGQESFWLKLEQLVQSNQIKIDRLKGSRHPVYPDLVYPFDYGYLLDTQAMDKGGIDLWIGSQGIHTISGIVCTVDTLKKDSEIKILLGCTEKDVQEILAVHNQFSQAGIWIPHPLWDKH